MDLFQYSQAATAIFAIFALAHCRRTNKRRGAP
jgi:hypothetical protein